MYKIVPHLEKDEYERERKFYADRGLPCPKDQIAEESEEAKKEEQLKEEKMTPDEHTNMDFHRFDEQVSLLLECKERPRSPPPATAASGDDAAAAGGGALHLRRKYVRCSSLATVSHLRKFVAKKLLHSSDRYKDVEVTCNDEQLYKDHTLKFVYVTRWRTKDPPMRLQFAVASAEKIAKLE